MFVVVALCAAASPAGADEATLPNLTPAPPESIVVAQADLVEDPDAPQPELALRFGTTTFNVGDYPLDLMFTPASVQDIQQNGRDIQQCTGFVGPACIGRSPAGRAFYHPVHGHWHMEAYADYALLPVTAEGMPDFDAAPVVPGTKASFCIMDTDASSDAAITDVGVYQSCNSLHQGMSPKHGDTYGRDLPGQQLVIDGVTPGIYAIVITVNPDGRIHETASDDNRSWAVIDLAVDRCHDGEVAVLRTGVS